MLPRIFRRLLPGPLGEDARAELTAGYRRRRATTGAVSAWIWYAGHLLHPDTWRLALALRRDETRRRAAAAALVGPPRTRVGARISGLDFKLAYRMLVKHPGLTVTAGLAIAFAVALAAVSFEFFTDVFYPTLPVDEPHELVEIRTRVVRSDGFHTRVLDDFESWREDLGSVDEIGAFDTFQRTLRTDAGGAQVLSGASMTAAAFQIARVPPLMGRGLVPSDELVGAPRVVVISHRVWRSLFAGNADVVGRTVRLESQPATVVGVMPEGFRFPRYHDLWAPFRHTAADFAPGQGPAIQVVARLAPGLSLRAAQAELTAIGRRAAADDPSTHEHLRPEVVPYGRLPLPQPGAVTAGIYWASVLFFAMLLVLVFGNVALLLFARTAAREREIVVRSALGASRARIVAQLVAEALVLAGGAAVLGLAVAEMGLELLVGIMRELQGAFFGYWVGGQISTLTAAYTIALTVSGAVACGVLPALKVTGRGGASSRQGLGVAAPGPAVGRLWTGIIVAQIAATAAFMPPLIIFGLETAAIRNADFGFPAAEYLSVRLRTDRPPISGLTLSESRIAHTARYLAVVGELEKRLEAEPRIGAVTAAGQVPGGYHDYQRVEVDGAVTPASSASAHRVQSVGVDADFFAALRTPIVAGRGFDVSDIERTDPVVVVNEDFVRVVLGGRSPIGRRVRYMNSRDPDAERPRFEIVGVVQQIAMNTDPNSSVSPGVYHLLRRADVSQLRLIMWTGGNAASFAPRVRALAAEVAPTLQLLDIRPVSEAAWDRDLAHVAVFWLMMVAGGMAVLLSLSGIHAILSFSVSRRTREIGVRVALGAGRVQVVSAVLKRTLRQIVIGVATGGLISLGVMYGLLVGEPSRPTFSATYVGLFGSYLAAMTCVCLLAAIVPTQRALRIEPTQALKEDR
jgi:predicted permease